MPPEPLRQQPTEKPQHTADETTAETDEKRDFGCAYSDHVLSFRVKIIRFIDHDSRAVHARAGVVEDVLLAVGVAAQLHR
jgi:hypothetical protein